jgi:Acyl-CoA dehydrogenase, C-terminal domain
MSRIGELKLGEVGVEAAQGLGDILQRAVGSELVWRYVEETPLPWTIVQEGGWDMLGVAEEDDGPGATLRDLVEVARVWGMTIAPTPLIPTIMSKRWSAVAREHDGPMALSVRTRASVDKGVVVFGTYPGIFLLETDAGKGSLRELSDASSDSYAPSLRLAESPLVSSLSQEAQRELCVVWAAEASGCAAKVLGNAVLYVKEREQFGQPIGRFQAIKHHLANAHLLSEEAETAVIFASLEPERAVAATRFALDASLRVIEIAIQVHGGLGFTWEMGLHMYMRHVNALRELSAGLLT